MGATIVYRCDAPDCAAELPAKGSRGKGWTVHGIIAPSWKRESLRALSRHATVRVMADGLLNMELSACPDHGELVEGIAEDWITREKQADIQGAVRLAEEAFHEKRFDVSAGLLLGANAQRKLVH